MSTAAIIALAIALAAYMGAAMWTAYLFARIAAESGDRDEVPPLGVPFMWPITLPIALILIAHLHGRRAGARK